MDRCIALLLALSVTQSYAAITLEELSDIYLPSSVNPADVYTYNSDSATCGAFSSSILRDFYYVGGRNIISVYDVTRIGNPRRRHTKTLTGGTIGDMEICGQYVAVAKDNTISPVDGQIIIYRRYDFDTDTMEKLHEISVGTNPRDLDFTSDCRKIVVAVEGTLTNIDGTVYDPEGLVAVITWPDDDLSEPYTLQLATFTSFNSRADEYIAKGVRWVYRGQGSGIVNTFSQDLEPESIELDESEEKAYIILQENNAVAIMDLANATIEEIVALGVKDFSVDGLDASDRDGGIYISPWPVRGLYQPSRAQITTMDGVEYLMTVNEGMEREFTLPDYPFNWRESKTGQEIVAEGLLAEGVSEEIKAMLQNDQQLGRTRFSTIDGLSANGSGIETLYVYGGRSYSFYFLSNLSLAYESRNGIELALSSATPTVFNSDPEQSTLTPVEAYDTRSPYKGPQPDDLRTFSMGDRNIIFLGIGRPGQIMIYSSPQDEAFVPQLEGVYYQGGAGLSYNVLYEEGEARSLGIEQMQVIPGNQNINDYPLLVVIGRVSGTVVFFRIRQIQDSFLHRFLGMVKGVPSSMSTFGKSILSQNPEAGFVQPVAVAAICLSVIALLIGAVLLVVNVNNHRRMRIKKASVFPEGEKGLPLQ